jgi:hypothetical protein
MISGWCGSGKDLLADFLVNLSKGNRNPNNIEIFRDVVKLSVANELKQLVATKYNFPLDLTLTQEGKKTKVNTVLYGQKTVRDLLVDEALTQKTLLGDNVFITHLSDKIMHMDYIAMINNKDPPHIVIPDFRFHHEYEYMTKRFNSELLCAADFTLDKIPSEVISIRLNRFDEPPLKIPSETELDLFNFDFVFENKSTITELLKFGSSIHNFIQANVLL